MQLLNFDVDRIVIHQIFKRDTDGNIVDPIRSLEYTNFDQSAMGEFKNRVKDALGEGSKAVQMEIVRQEAEDLPGLIEVVASQNDDDFIVSSYDFATKLARAQHSRSIPGGILVVFTGTYGTNSHKFIGLIKAEVHSGYEKEENQETKEISLKFVEELLLTPGTRLYKTAAFFEKNNSGGNPTNLNTKWHVLVSDYQISKAEGKAAARYFYSDFLGCGYPETSARTTKQFYEASSQFISQMSVDEEKKIELINALNTYLKTDASSTVSASEFAERYLDEIDLQDSFTNHLRDCGLPGTAFTKDIEHIETKLKTRKVNFSKNVKITAPSNIFKDLISFETIEGDTDESGITQKWTKVIIKDQIIGQE